MRFNLFRSISLIVLPFYIAIGALHANEITIENETIDNKRVFANPNGDIVASDTTINSSANVSVKSSGWIHLSGNINISGVTNFTPGFTNFDLVVPTGSTNIASGYFSGNTDVQIQTDAENIIYFTLNGEDPTVSSQSISTSELIVVTQSSTLKFFIVNSSGVASAIYTKNYFINNGPIVLDIDPPNISLVSPLDGGFVSSSSNVLVQVMSDEDGVVLINRKQAVFNAAGYYELEIEPVEGENSLYVSARDNYYNFRNKEFKFTADSGNPLINLLTPVSETSETYTTGGNLIFVSGTVQDTSIDKIEFIPENASVVEAGIVRNYFSGIVAVTEASGNITVKATDTAGQITSQMIDISVDYSIQPIISDIIPLGDGSGVNGGENVQITGTNFREGVSALIGVRSIDNFVVIHDQLAEGTAPISPGGNLGDFDVTIGTSVYQGGYSYSPAVSSANVSVTDRIYASDSNFGATFSFDGWSPDTVEYSVITKNGSTTNNTTVSSGNFNLNPNLSEGENEIRIKFSDSVSGKEVENSYIVVQDTVDPNVSVHSRFDTMKTIEDSIHLAGTYTEENMETITVGGVNAEFSDGIWRAYSVPVSSIGINNFTVEATDKAGNSKTASVSITKIVDASDFKMKLSKWTTSVLKDNLNHSQNGYYAQWEHYKDKILSLGSNSYQKPSSGFLKMKWDKIEDLNSTFFDESYLGTLTSGYFDESDLSKLNQLIDMLEPYNLLNYKGVTINGSDQYIDTPASNQNNFPTFSQAVNGGVVLSPTVTSGSLARNKSTLSIDKRIDDTFTTIIAQHDETPNETTMAWDSSWVSAIIIDRYREVKKIDGGVAEYDYPDHTFFDFSYQANISFPISSAGYEAKTIFDSWGQTSGYGVQTVEVDDFHQIYAYHDLFNFDIDHNLSPSDNLCVVLLDPAVPGSTTEVVLNPVLQPTKKGRFLNTPRYEGKTGVIRINPGVTNAYEFIPINYGKATVTFTHDDKTQEIEVVGYDDLLIEYNPIPTNSSANVYATNASSGLIFELAPMEDEGELPEGISIEKVEDGRAVIRTGDGTGPFKVICYHPKKRTETEKELHAAVTSCDACSVCVDVADTSVKDDKIYVNNKVPDSGNHLERGGNGSIELMAESGNSDLSTPASLRYNVRNRNVVVNRDDNSNLRQVYTPDGLVDVVTRNSRRYELRYYKKDNVIDGGSRGLFIGKGEPYARTIIENPDLGSSHDKLRVTKIVGSKTIIDEFERVSGKWHLKKGYDPDGDTYLSKTVNEVNGLEEKNTVYTSDSEIAAEVVTNYTEYDFGKVITSQAIGGNTANWIYVSDNTLVGYGKLKEYNNFNGSWYKNEYGSDNLLIKTISQYKGSGNTDSNESNHRVVSYDYTTLPAGSGDDSSVKPESPRLIIEKVGGYEVSRSYTVFGSNVTKNIQCVKTGAAWDDATNLETVTYNLTTGEFKDRTSRVEHADGTLTLYQYEMESDGGYKETVWSGKPDSLGTVVEKGTKTITTYNKPGQREVSETIDIESALTISKVTVVNRDEIGRETLLTYLDGTTTEKEYDCCESDSVKGRDGVKTYTKTDAMGRVDEELVNGVTYKTIYDGDGNVIENQRKGKEPTDVFVTTGTAVFDLSGRQISATNAAGNTTYYSMTNASVASSGFEESTTTYPNGSYQTTYSYPDGLLNKVSGNATYDVFYEYGTLNNETITYIDAASGTEMTYTANVQWTKVYQGSDAQATEWTQTFTDGLGRSYKTKLADGTVISESIYNTKGQLAKTISGNVWTYYFYNDEGEQNVTAIDMNKDGIISYSGIDRIVKSESDFTTYNSQTVRRSRSWIYETDNSSTETLKSTSYQSLTSLDSWSDVHGQITHSQSVLDGNGGKVVTVKYNDDSKTITSSTNNLVDWTKREDSNGTQIGRVDSFYDNYNRNFKTMDAYSGNTVVEFNNLDRVWKVTAPDPDGNENDSSDVQTTESEFNSVGQQVKVTTNGADVVNFTYFSTGELKKKWGNKTYPVEYTYERGRMKTMKTWKDYNLQTGAAITTWVYDSQRGWLKEKVYDDNKKTKYTYYAATGMLKTREWERGVTTTYSYTDANELKLVDYSDSTTDISYTYKRDGKRYEVTDDTGTRYFDYTAEGLLDSEDYYPGSDFYGRMISIEYDNKLRKDKFSLVADSSTTLNYTIGYDLASRKNNFSNGSQSVTYARHANTNLINTKTFGTTNTVTTTVFDKVNRLKSTSTVNNLSTVLKSQAYTINRENQRTQVDLEDGNHWHFAYDYYGQVILGEKRTSGNVAISGNSFSYAADSIGNRTSETINGVSRTFSSNLLNQYTTISGNSGLAHDDDGNMTNDGTWEMVYNGENRLIEMVKSNDKKLKFFYDYMGRRWKKEVYDWISGAWVKVEAKLFRYDGWNLVAEIDNMNSNTLVKSYMWALDLSGTEQGAGGVGGLISMTVHTGNPISYYYIHDGNGNVSGLVNALTGVLTHTYEYDPFGNVVSGQYDGANHFRHATKYQDLESNYYYYGYRYYSSEIGRWNRRDPAEEQAGPNVMAFNSNDGINSVDFLGLLEILAISPVIDKVYYSKLGAFIANTTLVKKKMGSYWVDRSKMSKFSKMLSDPMFIRIVGRLNIAAEIDDECLCSKYYKTKKVKVNIKNEKKTKLKAKINISYKFDLVINVMMYKMKLAALGVTGMIFSKAIVAGGALKTVMGLNTLHSIYKGGKFITELNGLYKDMQSGIKKGVDKLHQANCFAKLTKMKIDSANLKIDRKVDLKVSPFGFKQSKDIYSISAKFSNI